MKALRRKWREDHTSLGQPVFLGRVISRWPQIGTLGEQQAHGGLTVVLSHGGLKIGGRQILRMGLMRAPLHEQTVADAAE